MGILSNTRDRAAQAKQEQESAWTPDGQSQQTQQTQTAQPAGDPFAGQNHQQIAQNNLGFNGWNSQNIWDHENILGNARTFQEQGGATAGLRDYMQGGFNEFMDPKVAQYRQMMGVGDGNADAADAGVWSDPRFKAWVTSGVDPRTGAGSGGGSGQSQTMTSWTGGDPNTQQRRGDLWGMLMDRAQQGLNVDRTNPAVRSQADAYNANEERARRDYVSDVAESSGPYANIRGQERMAAERMGQRTGAFESELVGREIAAKRQEIEHALTTMSDLLPEDQRLELQRYLAELDNAYKMNALTSNNDQFASQLGFDYADRSSYWDAVRRGLLG